MRIRPAVVAACLFTCLAGCGGSSGDGDGPPTNPGSTTTSVAVSLRDVVLVGTTATATATATLSNGQTQAVTTGFRSDTPGVASVTDGGTVTGVGNGEATITVSSGGRDGTRRLRVAPNYAGRWQGRQHVKTCAATGAFVGVCEQTTDLIGGSLAAILDARQGNDLGVSGEFNVDGVPYPTFSTLVEADGRIRFSSSIVSDGVRLETSWDMSSTTTGRSSGTVRDTFSVPGVPGDVRFDSDLVDFNRTTTASAALAPVPGGHLSRLARLRRYLR